MKLITLAFLNLFLQVFSLPVEKIGTSVVKSSIKTPNTTPVQKLLCLGNDGKTNKRSKCLVGEVEVAPNRYKIKPIQPIDLGKKKIVRSTAIDIRKNLLSAKTRQNGITDLSTSQMLQTTPITFVNGYHVNVNQSVTILAKCPPEFPICLSAGSYIPHYEKLISDPRFKGLGALYWKTETCGGLPLLSVQARQELKDAPGYDFYMKINNLDISWWTEYNVTLYDSYDMYMAITCAPISQNQPNVS